MVTTLIGALTGYRLLRPYQKSFISAKMLAADFGKSLLATDSEASGSQLLGELGEGLLSLGNLGCLLGAVELDVAVR